MIPEETRLLTEATTDIKWIKASLNSLAEANCKKHEEIIDRLNRMNGKVNSNTTWITALKWVTGALALAILSIGLNMIV